MLFAIERALSRNKVIKSTLLSFKGSIERCPCLKSCSQIMSQVLSTSDLPRRKQTCDDGYFARPSAYSVILLDLGAPRTLGLYMCLENEGSTWSLASLNFSVQFPLL